MNFAEWVRSSRDAARLSQEEAAKRAGVSQAQWAKYENQVGEPKKPTVTKIAMALGIPVDEAMEAAGYSIYPADVPQELVSAWNRVPTEKRPQFLRAVREMAGVF